MGIQGFGRTLRGPSPAISKNGPVLGESSLKLVDIPGALNSPGTFESPIPSAGISDTT